MNAEFNPKLATKVLYETLQTLADAADFVGEGDLYYELNERIAQIGMVLAAMVHLQLPETKGEPQ